MKNTDNTQARPEAGQSTILVKSEDGITCSAVAALTAQYTQQGAHTWRILFRADAKSVKVLSSTTWPGMGFMMLLTTAEVLSLVLVTRTAQWST